MDLQDNDLLVQINRAKHDISSARWSLFGYRGAGLALRVLLLVISAACLYGSYKLPLGSFAQDVLSNAWTGFAVFALFGPLLRLAAEHRSLLAAFGLVVAVCLAVGAYLSQNVTRSVLINASLSVLLLIALDLNVDRWLKAYEHAEATALTQIGNAREKIRAAESDFDYKYAWHEFLGLPRGDQMGGIPHDEDD